MNFSLTWNMYYFPCFTLFSVTVQDNDIQLYQETPVLPCRGEGGGSPIYISDGGARWKLSKNTLKDTCTRILFHRRGSNEF